MWVIAKYFPLIVLVLFEVPVRGQLRTGAVDVVVETILGEALQPDEIELVDPATKRTVFRGSHAKDVPYGENVLRVWARGFRRYEQRLRVFQNHVYAHVRLTLSQIADEPPPQIKGRIVSPTTVQGLWVRLVPLIANGSPPMDYLVTPEGNFEFSGMDSGEYMVLVVRDRRCIYTRQVSTAIATVNIDLGADLGR